MREDGPFTAGENGRQKMCTWRLRSMSDGVDALVHSVKASRLVPPGDLGVGEPDLAQLVA
jgi:hypothetical protein